MSNTAGRISAKERFRQTGNFRESYNNTQRKKIAGLDDIKTKNKYPDDRSFIEEIEDFIIREESRYKAYLT